MRLGSVVVGLAAALGALPLALPGSAAAPACSPLDYAASASADVVRLGLLDLRPLGVPLAPVAEVGLGTSRSAMDARKPVKARADARYAEARLLGKEAAPLFLSSAVSQQAPPTHAKPSTYTGFAQNAGLAKVGTGEISAHATWSDKMACGKDTGPAGVSSAAVADLALLPGLGNTALVRAPRNVSSQTATGLRSLNGATAAVAAAEIELADLQLLSGALGVKVLKPPTLTATSTGSAKTSSVQYTAPVLEISGSGLPTQRLDSPSKHIDLALPPSALALPGASTLAGTEGLPLLSGNPLGGLLGGLNLTQLRGLVGGVSPEGLSAPGLGSLAVLRISLGAVDKKITDGVVSAEAASLRIQLLLRTPNRADARILDLGVGLLKATAVAPCIVTGPSASPSASASPSTSPSPGGPGSSPSASGCGGPGCPTGPGTEGDLPKTGMAPVAYVVGAGVLFGVAGRFLMLLARRRRHDALP
ncbi:MAG: hypothetical protein HOV79_23795 [Hamadaea sp.]|nr:hypothetical protein [Hamadaea sp.]